MTPSFRAGEEQRGLADLRILPGRGQLPVAVDVAVPVQAAAEAGFSIDLRESGKVGFGEPRRQRPRGIAAMEEAFTFLHELMRRRIGEAAAGEHGAHGERHVALELGFGDAGRLKILPVEIGDAALAQSLQRPAAAAEGRGHAQPRNPRENIRPEHRGVPGDRRAPIMADDESLLFAERRDQRDHVARGVEDAVGLDILRR